MISKMQVSGTVVGVSTHPWLTGPWNNHGSGQSPVGAMFHFPYDFDKCTGPWHQPKWHWSGTWVFCSPPHLHICVRQSRQPYLGGQVAKLPQQRLQPAPW